MTKKIISLILAITMLSSLIVTPVSAEDFNEYEEQLAVSTTSNIFAEIPENANNILNDLGLNNGLIADIKQANMFSLFNQPQEIIDVTLKTPNHNNGDFVDVIHFIEDPYYINEDTIIINVSNYSDESKDLLIPAIKAYQNAFDSEDEYVAIEIFEEIEVINDSITFNTESFSIFAVGDIGVTKYEFYLDDLLVNSQYLIGDSESKATLYSPDTPYQEGVEFLGWKIEGTEEYQKFGKINVNKTENETIRCNAEFNKVYYVYFLYEAKEGAYILDTLSGKTGDTIYTDKVDYPINLDKHVISWHNDVDLQSTPITEVILDKENIILYPNVQKGFWITFYTDGGNMMAPEFYASNEPISNPTIPIKTGYEFAGWVDSEGNPFEFNGQILTKSEILTATWNPQNVNYTVQIMLQDPNNITEYNPVTNGFIVKTGEVASEIFGSSITEVELTNLIDSLSSDNYFKKYLKYFYLNTDQTNKSSVVLSGDGSSVLYVYYDRYPYLMNFYLSTDDYTNNVIYKTSKGKFDAIMPYSEWANPDKSELENFTGWYSPVGNVYSPWTGFYNHEYAEFDTDSNSWIMKYRAVTSKARSWATYYYLQTLNPDGTVADVGYSLDEHTVKPDINAVIPTDFSTESEKANWSNLTIDNINGVIDDLTNNGAWTLHSINYYASDSNFNYWDDPIAGFTLVALAMDCFAGNGLSGDEYDIIRVPSRDKAYIAYRDDNLIIDGTQPLLSGRWFTVSENLKLMKFCGHLYIRYLRNSYDLEFIADGNIVKTFDVYYETNLGLDKFINVSNELTVPEGYQFGGWYTSADLDESSRFNLESNTMPASDIKLYAKWVPKIVDIDVHITIDGIDTIIEGVNGFTVKYAEKVDKAKVENLKSSVNMPAEAIWYGWYEKVDVGGGKTLLVPFNFDKQLVNDLVLYPFYSYTTPVQIKYDLNGATGTTPIDNYRYALGKGAVVLFDENIKNPPNTVFAGWNTEIDGSGKSYYPGDIAIIDKDNMVLYAQWTHDSSLDKTTLTYKNTITSESVTETFKNNETIFIKDTSVFKNRTSQKYIFKEWNTSRDGSGISFAPNDKIVLSEDNVQNVLYAIYEVDPNYTPPYIPPTRYKYTIKYLDENQNVLADDMIFSASYGSTITKYPIEIEGYTPINEKGTLKITRNEKDNVIIFIYKKIKDINDKFPVSDYLINGDEHIVYIVGYTDGTVGPNRNMTRGEAATVFYRLLKPEIREKYKTIENTFTDVPNDLWCNEYISTIANIGIVAGYSDGSFKPHEPITRAEFTTMMTRFFDEKYIEYQGYFNDVKANDWHSKYIETAFNIGLIVGYPNNNFGPYDYITRAQACTIINRALHRIPEKEHIFNKENMKTWPDNNENDWFYLEIQEATNGHKATYENDYEIWVSPLD